MSQDELACPPVTGDVSKSELTQPPALKNESETRKGDQIKSLLVISLVVLYSATLLVYALTRDTNILIILTTMSTLATMVFTYYFRSG